jgi:hypothetical protein
MALGEAILWISSLIDPMRFAPLFLLALMACQESVPPAQVDRTPNLQPAFQQFTSGNVEGALATLDSLEAAHPDAPPIFAARGQFLRQSQELEGSLAAYQQAARLAPTGAGTLFQLAVAYGLLEQDDEAIDALGRARDAGFNIFNIANSAPGARLAEHPGYASLFPSHEDYADPFVEGTRIIHDWTGENPRDQFGWVARNVGDVDGDGVDDAASSATTNNDGAQAGGKIYIYSGRSGALLWSAVGSDAGGRLGFVVEGAGDVNGDGTPDVIAGAPYANKAFVYSGLDGGVILTLAGDDPAGAFGAGVTGVGDVNGDGFGDLLVGEPHQIWGAPLGGGPLGDPGAAHVFSGRDGSTLLSLTGESPGDGFGATLAAGMDGSVFVVGAPSAGGEAQRGQAYVYHGLDAEPAFVLAPSESGVNFGAMFMSVMGDADGDGVSDIYVSDWADGSKGPSTGRIYVFSGADGSKYLELEGEAAGDGYGIGVSDAGDIDGDGRADLIIGAWQHASAAASGGKLYAHSGADGALLYTVTGKVMGETLGFDTTGLGDVDGDGTVDFLVTSAWSGINGFQSGRTLVISGRN